MAYNREIEAKQVVKFTKNGERFPTKLEQHVAINRKIAADRQSRIKFKWPDLMGYEQAHN